MPPNSLRSTAILIGSAFLAFGCADSPGDEAGQADDTFLLRDSAGVTIVESSGPAWSEETAWRLGAEPEVVIGRDGSDSDAQLFGVRGLARLSDGRIAILNQGTREVRVYSATGDFLYASGGDGDGPGEIRRPIQMARLRADTLVVNDLPDLEFFDAAGQPARVERIDWGDALAHAPAGFSFGNVREVLPDGSLFLWAYQYQGQLPNGPFADSIVVMRYWPAADRAVTSGRWLYARAVASDFEGSRLVATHPLSLHVAWGVGGSPERPLVAVGHPDEPEIHVYGDDGAAERILRWSAPAIPVRSEDEERAVAVEREGLPEEDFPRFNRLMEIADRPSTLPFFSNLAVDEEGNVWARDFRADWREATDFTVFDSQGRWLGSIDFPEDLNLDEFAMGPVIGPDWVLGVWKDDFDVEEVRLYRLIKP